MRESFLLAVVLEVEVYRDGGKCDTGVGNAQQANAATGETNAKSTATGSTSTTKSTAGA
jgi:hypothetical protein